MSISDINPSILKYRTKWKRNRDIVEGEDAVKAERETYLPKLSSEQTSTEYDCHLKHVPFYPAASRTLDGYMGLMFRKRVVLEATASVEALTHAITKDGKSLDDLAELVTREVLTVNWGGLLVDHPPMEAPMSVAQALEAGVRAWIAHYEAEAVLDVQWGVVRNRKALVRVVLQDDENTIRELLLEDGTYAVQMHRKLEGEWVPAERTVPLMRGKPLTEIPFVLLNHDNAQLPTPAVLTDTVLLNIQHYIVAADLAMARRLIAMPVPYVAGADNDDGELAELSVAPGNLWRFKSENTKVGFLEIGGQGIPAIERERDKMEQQISVVSLNMLAAQKNAVEAAETHRLRTAAENSVLAGIARVISRKIKQALDIMAAWTDESEVQFAINTDFLPGELPPGLLKEIREAVAAGLVSRESFFYMLRDGEIHDATLTWEMEQQRLANDPSPVVEQPAAPTTDAE